MLLLLGRANKQLASFDLERIKISSVDAASLDNNGLAFFESEQLVGTDCDWFTHIVVKLDGRDRSFCRSSFAKRAIACIMPIVVAMIIR
jgi:hypothetical protein